jgi:hypothetical protein
MDEFHKDKLKEKLRLDESYRNKFAQKLLLVLDRFADLEKAAILARVVSAYAEDRIDSSTMERLFYAVDRLFVQDVVVLNDFYNYRGRLDVFID